MIARDRLAAMGVRFMYFQSIDYGSVVVLMANLVVIGPEAGRPFWILYTYLARMNWQGLTNPKNLGLSNMYLRIDIARLLPRTVEELVLGGCSSSTLR